ncbi:MAG: 50S ribosomal protein L24 [Eubacteriales bacterium]|jgi:large subunit ribosomal protein L24|nr:50S ribosomal protein L24 [Clostridiales bacterium]MDD7396523.1 50S ribosomal protein L24 [Eubacteriales bacterium]
MNKLNVRKGDKVRIISGKDSGKEGKILTAMPEKERVIVEDCNMVTRHVKPRRQGEAGGRIEQAGSIHVSNVQLVCPSCKMPTRVAHQIVEVNGKKKSVRVCKQCGKQID